jgi:hypothetical protein
VELLLTSYGLKGSVAVVVGEFIKEEKFIRKLLGNRADPSLHLTARDPYIKEISWGVSSRT